MKNIKTDYSVWESKEKKRMQTTDYTYMLIFVFLTAVTLNIAFNKAYSFIGDRIVDWEKDSNSYVYAEEVVPEVKEIVELEKVVVDFRIEKLQLFLEDKDSPLAPYAEYIVEQSDINGIDWTIIISISRIESDYCKKTIADSHNCWGLGGSNFMHFDSYEDAISYEARLLNKYYRKSTNEAIKTKYCPSSDGCNPEWADVVTDTSHSIISLKTEK